MNDKNNEKLNSAKKFLDARGIFYTENANGHLKADRVNLWVTTEKWYDEKRGKKGVGINSFVEYLEGIKS